MGPACIIKPFDCPLYGGHVRRGSVVAVLELGRPGHEANRCSYGCLELLGDGFTAITRVCTPSWVGEGGERDRRFAECGDMLAKRAVDRFPILGA
jgi:hypothetical protein